LSTSRRKILQMAGAIGAGGMLSACGSQGSRDVYLTGREMACETHGTMRPNPIGEYQCCDGSGPFPNPAGLPNPTEGPIEVISEGYLWTEGPTWVGDKNGYLLFSDVPGNAIYKWDGQTKTTSTFLKPSGSQLYPTPYYVREDGINGLALGRGGLIGCDNGERAIVWIDMETRRKTIIADNYNGRRFNGTNDVVISERGEIYFTDPVYAINANYHKALFELDYTGVFKIDTQNRVHLIADNLRPNGISLTPDNKMLVVTDSSGWVAIDLDQEGMPLQQRQFVSREVTGGGADGMQMDHVGRLWTTSTGGIHVFSPAGEHIAFLPIDTRLGNCNFGADGYLYVSNCDRMIRAKIKPEFA